MNRKDISKIELDNIDQILFLGIGGIGMSALAKYFLNKNVMVFGYDKTPSEMTKELESMGAKVFFEDNSSITENSFDLVIYTPAIPKTSFLLYHYQSSETPLLKRSEVLGLITKSKFTIAVSGSHGKTTISAMLTHLLKESGIDCSAFLGGVSVNYDSNYILGKSDVIVAEADEFDRSFLTLSPNIIVLTSMDIDHLDVYGSRDKLVSSFQEFINKLDPKGTLIINEKVKTDIQTSASKKVYGLDEGDFKVENIDVQSGFSKFKINQFSEQFKLNYNGRHNIENAIAAITVGHTLNIKEEKMAEAISSFKGIKRRFELIYKDEKAVFIDDYAHHPAEIRALLSSIKEIYPKEKVLSIFQPHLFSRTKDLCQDFAESLDISDECILLPIYPARELPIDGVTSYNISDRMVKKVKVVDKADLIDALKQRNFGVILTIGAGDISHCISDIKSYLSTR